MQILLVHVKVGSRLDLADSACFENLRSVSETASIPIIYFVHKILRQNYEEVERVWNTMWLANHVFEIPKLELDIARAFVWNSKKKKKIIIIFACVAKGGVVPARERRALGSTWERHSGEAGRTGPRWRTSIRHWIGIREGQAAVAQRQLIRP